MQKSIINRFTSDNEIYSNFYPCVVYFEAMEFPSVEHAYVAAKSYNMLFRKEISEMPPDSAGLAKRKGRSINLRPDWDLVKLSVMRSLLEQKFSQSPFREQLLSTGDAILIEGNYWHDNYWGDCFCTKCKNIKGKNRLGKLIMKIREELKNESINNGGCSQRVRSIKRCNK